MPAPQGSAGCLKLPGLGNLFSYPKRWTSRSENRANRLYRPVVIKNNLLDGDLQDYKSFLTNWREPMVMVSI